MRTTITLPDELIKDILHYTHAKKATEAVNIVIEDWVRLKKISKIKELRGKLDIEDNVRALRAREIKKRKKWDE